ncbi:hypothetical protein INR49_028859, partial [Caranx melampygus]
MSCRDINPVLLKISDQLSSEQLDKMKFLCKDDIGKKDMERISTGSKLFQFLMERGKLSADNTEYVCRLLSNIQRHDLADQLHSLGESEEIQDQPDETERAKLDIATDVIADNLGRHWRKLGRKLNLKEVTLDSIGKRHPTDLEETVRELLKEWRRRQGVEARVEELINALRLCQLNLTADKVADKLKDSCAKALTALVQPVQPVNVIPAHLGGLAKGHVRVGDGHHGGTVVLGEGIPGGSQMPQYKTVHLDVAVPVRASLLVVEAEGMEQLVLDSAVIEASLTAQRDSLSAALTTH